MIATKTALYKDMDTSNLLKYLGEVRLKIRPHLKQLPFIRLGEVGPFHFRGRRYLLFPDLLMIPATLNTDSRIRLLLGDTPEKGVVAVRSSDDVLWYSWRSEFPLDPEDRSYSRHWVERINNRDWIGPHHVKVIDAGIEEWFRQAIEKKKADLAPLEAAHGAMKVS